MSELELYLKLSHLTPDLKAEANDFIEFLLSKKRRMEEILNRNLDAPKGK